MNGQGRLDTNFRVSMEFDNMKDVETKLVEIVTNPESFNETVFDVTHCGFLGPQP